MHDIEQRLVKPRRVGPSPEHAEKMDQVFALETAQRAGLWERPVPLWQCLTACVVCMLCVVLGMRHFESEPARSDPAPVLFVVPPLIDGNVSPFDLTQAEHNLSFQGGSVRVTVEEKPITPHGGSIQERKSDDA